MVVYQKRGSLWGFQRTPQRLSKACVHTEETTRFCVHERLERVQVNAFMRVLVLE